MWSYDSHKTHCLYTTIVLLKVNNSYILILWDFVLTNFCIVVSMGYLIGINFSLRLLFCLRKFLFLWKLIPWVFFQKILIFQGILYVLNSPWVYYIIINKIPFFSLKEEINQYIWRSILISLIYLHKTFRKEIFFNCLPFYDIIKFSSILNF